MKPQRIQLSRKHGWRMPENTVKVDRSTQWGNPFKVGEILLTFGGKDTARCDRLTPKGAVDAFHKQAMNLSASAISNIQEHLRGKNLACWCALDEPCHADVLLEIANKENGHES